MFDFEKEYEHIKDTLPNLTAEEVSLLLVISYTTAMDAVNNTNKKFYRSMTIYGLTLITLTFAIVLLFGK
jgi:hypothetical protein